MSASEPPAGPSRWEWSVVAVLGIAGLLFRAIFLPYERIITDDGVYYISLGLELIAGNWQQGLSAYWPPLYPLLIGIASLVVPDPALAGQWVSMVAGTLLIPVAYLLARDCCNRRAALISAALVSFNPYLALDSARVSTGAAYALFFILGVRYGWRALERLRAADGVIAAAALSLAYLLRPEAIGFLVYFVGLAVIVHLIRRPGARRTLVVLMLILGMIGIFAVPYLVLVRQRTGHWTPSEKFETHVGGHNVGWLRLTPDGRTTRADIFYAGDRRAPVEVTPTRRDPSSAGTGRLKEAASNAVITILYEYREILPSLFPPLFLVLAGLGLFNSAWDRRRAWREAYFGSIVVATFAGYALAWSVERYFYPLLPILGVWAAGGVVALEDWLAKTATECGLPTRHPSAWLRWLILAGVVASTLPQMTFPIRKVEERQTTELRDAGRWIREQASADTLVLSSSPVVSYFAGTKHAYLPDEEIPLIVDYARRRGATFVTVHELKVNSHRLHTQRPMLDAPTEIEGLEPVWIHDEKPKQRVVVFRVIDQDETDGSSSE